LLELSEDIPDHQVTNKWSSKYNLIFNQIRPGQKLCNVRFSDTSVYTWRIPEVFGEVDDEEVQILETIAKNRRHKKFGNKANGNPLSLSTIEELSGLFNVQDKINRLVLAGYLKEEDNKFDLKGAMFASGLFRRPNWDEPSQTVLTNYHNPRYFLHPLRDRPFSARECARLQGFPDDFLFSWGDYHVRLEDRYTLIGNAVAVPVSRAIANSVKKFLFEIERDYTNAIKTKSSESYRKAIGI
jgi:DNA (cytosine-5)-methyltransferase 1